MGDKYKIDWYCEECCEVCNEVIHTHFPCPICKNDYAGTSMYHAPWDWDDKEFECESCGAKFNIIENEDDDCYQTIEHIA